jgi:hypothetical protein
MLYKEIALETIDDIVLSSDVCPATEQEIEYAKEQHAQGHCPHNIVIDDSGWLYGIRKCAICGKGLGTV